jgi:tetratricopeptide (TPR) repeat protein
MLRESLERRAREANRWKWYQKICAKMLKEKVGYSIAERLGRHLLAADQGEEALEHLLAGARTRIDIGDYQIAQNLLSKWRQTMESLKLPTNDERWGHGWVLWSKYAITQGSLDQADDWAARVEKAARKYDWKTVRAYALRERGRISRERGQVSRAWRRLQEAEVLAQKIGDRELLAQCRQDMGNVLVDRGSNDRAAKCFRRARQDFDAIQDAVGAGSSSLGLGNVSMRAGNFEDASKHVEQARSYFDQCGARSGVANCQNVLGEIARLRGELEKAEQLYRSSLSLYQIIGTGSEPIPKVNLGLVLVDREL